MSLKLARAAARDPYITQQSRDKPTKTNADGQSSWRGQSSASAASQGSAILFLWSFHQTPLIALFASGAETVDILFPRPFSFRFACVALFFLPRIPFGALFFTRLHRPCAELSVHCLSHPLQSCRIATRLTQSSMMMTSFGEWNLLSKNWFKCALTLEFDSPLCIEEFDLSDKNFRPCPCGYQVSCLSSIEKFTSRLISSNTRLPSGC
jgi:hypothetical protein